MEKCGFELRTIKKRKRFLRWISIIAMTLCMSLLWTQAVRADETEKVTADILRQAQQGIQNWNLAQTGETQVLAGSILDDVGDAGSDWVAFDVARTGQLDNQAAYLYRMRQAVEKIYVDLDTNMAHMRVTDLQRMALAVKACGGDPTAFGTDAKGNPINLVADGTWNCIFGDLGKQGLNGYIWALIVMDSDSYEVPEGAAYTREDVLQAILARQQEDGGFSLQQTDASDCDITAMALTALASCQGQEETYTVTNLYTEAQVTTTVDEAAQRAFACLSTMQQDDGSMITYKQRTSESTSWTIVALASWNRDARGDADFIKNNGTLLDGLMEFRLDDGSFIHTVDAEEPETEGNAMAGYQAWYALEACVRQMEQSNRLFDLTDATALTQEEIDAAGADLPELTEAVEKDAQTAKKDTQDRTVLLTAIIAGAVVVLVLLFLILLLRSRKKKKEEDKKRAGTDSFEDDEDDDW